MNNSWSGILKYLYRKDRIATFIVIVGAVDAAIGGVDESWSLFAVGLSTIGAAFVYRLLSFKGNQIEEKEQSPQYYLPPQSSATRGPLPNLSNKRNSRL